MGPKLLSINTFPPVRGKLVFMFTKMFPRSFRLAALCGGVTMLALSGCEEESISGNGGYGSSA